MGKRHTQQPNILGYRIQLIRDCFVNGSASFAMLVIQSLYNIYL